MFPNQLLPRGRALAILSVALACGLSLFTLGGYAQATEAVGELVTASQTSAAGPGANNDEDVRPFHIHVSSEQLDDLRKRIAETRWPDQETVNDESQGIRLAEARLGSDNIEGAERLAEVLASRVVETCECSPAQATELAFNGSP
jgi:hypothetical protein